MVIHLYKAVEGDIAVFIVFKGKCQDLGGSLPNIYSAEKQKLLENFISSHYNGTMASVIIT